MYAIIKTGGKQYRVAEGEEVKVERLPGVAGDDITFDKVLLTSDGENVKIGKPYLEDVEVSGHITCQGKDRKILVFKFKKRKGYRKKQGHRQEFTSIKIENIKA